MGLLGLELDEGTFGAMGYGSKANTVLSKGNKLDFIDYMFG